MRPAKSTLSEGDRENLVAYLDNELEAPSARALEAKLSRDPAARAEAEQMKRAWDMLDYLPRAEPSPNFTNRTMNRLSALRPLEARARRWKALLGWAAVFLFVSAASFGAYCALAKRQSTPVTTDQAIAQDLGVLQHLPTYMCIDDVGQLGYLDQPDLFGDDDVIAPLQSGSGSGESPTDPTALEHNRKRVEQLAAAEDEEYGLMKRRLGDFRKLPREKQDALRKLDRELNQDADTSARAQRWRILARYAAWIRDLDEEDQRRLQTADRDTWKRLVRELRDREWLSKQPRAVQDRIAEKAGKDQTDEIARLRQEERSFRQAWADRPRSSGEPASPLRPGHLPQEAQSFVHESLLPLLTPADKKEFDDANRDGGGRYVRTLLKLTEKYAPGCVSTPVPQTRGQLLQMYPDLKKHLTAKDEDRAEVKRLREAEGKWPEFGTAAIAFIRHHNPRAPLPKWAHAKPGDFEPAVQTFLANQLVPTLSAAEKEQLNTAEGKWPEYAHTLTKLAQDHGMTVPTLSLPGTREFWDKLVVSLPDEPDHILIDFASRQSGKDLATIQFSLADRFGRERLKEDYYRHNQERLQKRLLEDFQASLKKSRGA